jgi:hypothetical protein
MSGPNEREAHDHIAARLLFTDRHGEPTPVQDLMSDGLEGGYEDRIPGLIDLMEHGLPDHRLYACMILTAWGDIRGLRQIVDWARNPDSTPWAPNPITVDRIYGADSSFASLAQAVGETFWKAVSPELEAAQIDAITALLGVSSRRYVDRYLALTIAENPHIQRLVAPNIRAAIDAAIRRLESADPIDFDLAFQSASLVSALAPVDDAAAGHYARELASRFRSSERMLKELAAALGNGHGPATLRSLQEMTAFGVPELNHEIDAAIAKRELAN